MADSLVLEASWEAVLVEMLLAELVLSPTGLGGVSFPEVRSPIE
jgi:hypothetical protein